MRRAKIEASDALARRSVTVIGNDKEAEGTVKGLKRSKKGTKREKKGESTGQKSKNGRRSRCATAYCA